MATLNTLRTRGGIIVTIVIGIALVAFLLGDISGTSSRLMQNRKTRLGEINGTTIGYQEYYDQSELYTKVSQSLMGKENLSAQEMDGVRDMAWEALVKQHSFNPGFQTLGIEVAEGEQIDMVKGVYISPIIAQMFANRETGAFDPAFLNNFVSSIGQDASGRAAMLWSYMKEQMVDERATSKYAALVTKGIYVTDLEVEHGHKSANSTYGIRYVEVDPALVPDSTITVSDSEVKNYYEKNKKIFKQKATRDIEYVVFNLVPSEQDKADAQKLVDEIAADFKASTTPMQYATVNSQDKPDSRFYKETEMDALMAAALWGKSDAIYGPVMEGDTYVIARLGEMKNLPDSIGAKHILIPATESARADSLLAVIKKGGNFNELAKEFSVDPSAAQNGGDLGVFAPEMMVPEFSDACVKASKGDVFTVTSQFGVHIVQLTYKSTPVSKAQIAKITYKVDPSTFTQQSVYADASKFFGEAAGSYDNFKKAATEGALAKRVGRVTSSDRELNGLAESRELVRWAFNNEKNAVSQILEVGNDYVIAAITDVREDGVAAYDKVVADIRAKLVSEKKGLLLAEKIKGSTLDEVATNLKAEVKTAEGITFESFYVEGLGVEPRLIGAVCSGIAANKLSKPVIGNMSAYAFEVTTAENTESATTQSERVRLEAVSQNYASQRLNQAIHELSNIVDKRVKFF